MSVSFDSSGLNTVLTDVAVTCEVTKTLLATALCSIQAFLSVLLLVVSVVSAVEFRSSVLDRASSRDSPDIDKADRVLPKVGNSALVITAFFGPGALGD